MKFYKRKIAVVGVIAALTLSLAACSSEDGGNGGGGDAANGKVAFLMPNLASTRFEQQDSPLFKAKIKELCEGCEVIYQNADGDAAKQQQQADAAITQGAKVLVLNAVDTTAAASIVDSAQSQGVAVITYDRPIPKVEADLYISFDNEEIGRSIAQSLVDHLPPATGEQGILIVNGSPADNAAGLIRDGIHKSVDASDYTVLAEYDTPDWDPKKAQDWVSGQITQFGDKIIGVVAANDGTGGGSIAAFKAAGWATVPPVTGNDAEIAAIQRIVSGSQYNTISKPIKIVAEAAAEASMAFLKGEKPTGDADVFGTSARIFIPTVVTSENVKEVIFDGKIYTAAEVCTADYKAACDALGIK
ncbi:substrate-binding domain-containing protein [Mycetocola spongiae]|nr:substrate-binding domain-containing protein [Mycetocola spongiae]